MTHKVLAFVGSPVNADGQETISAAEHRQALAGRTDGHGRALMTMLKGWEDYAKAYRVAYDCPIGSDGVIGRYWGETGLAIKRLLDGQTGGLDCGSVAANITNMIEAEGLKTDGYTLE